MFVQPNNTNQDSLYFQQVIILMSNFLSVFCITFLIFVSWKKGPKLWLMISPYFFFCVLAMNYLIIPIINILISTFLICNPNWDLQAQTSESFVIFFYIICFMRVFEYFTIIRRTVLVDAKNFIATKRDLVNSTK